MKKFIKFPLAIGVAFCLWMASAQLYSFYYNHYPLASKGECLAVVYGNMPMKVTILSNNNEKGTSIVIVETYLINGTTFKSEAVATYKELRDMGAIKISCD
jgi:hypothetical protein